MMKEFWNSRYDRPEYVYGEKPNIYFAQQLQQYKPGNILLPAEGEGRNAVYAASLGWEVNAFDLSEIGKAKAEQLAIKHQVHIEYLVRPFEDIEFPPHSFDAIGLIYAHFPADKKAEYYQQLDHYLRPGGIIIAEVFSKAQLALSAENPQAGGPKNMDMLFSTEEIKRYFPNYEVMELEEVEVELAEGAYHQGKSAVIRFTGKKR